MRTPYKIKSRILDGFATDMLLEAKKDRFMRLSPAEAVLVNDPNKFLTLATLAEKLVIAQK